MLNTDVRLHNSSPSRDSRKFGVGNRFSVLASLYIGSKPSDLQRCLESVENQTLAPDQVVIVLDGPVVREIESLIYSFSTRLPIETLGLERNQGLGKALAAGLEICKHELVARVDTDDISLAQRFEMQVAFLLQNSEVAVLGAAMQETYCFKGKTVSRQRMGAGEQLDVTKLARVRNPLNHPTVMFRKTLVESVGGYVDCPFFEDYYLWARIISANHKIANLSEVLVETEIDESYFSRRGGWEYMRAERQFLIRLRKLGFLKGYHLVFWIVARTPLRILPSGLRKFVYMLFLRRT